MDLISVLMPTYNVEKYIRQAVESVLEQTWKNFEFIIVDDCSKDGTYKILSEYAEKDKRIKLYRNNVNSKICKTLNRALSYAQGNYIVRMDGDDISLPNRFERLYQYLQLHPEIDLVGSNTISIDENGEEIGRKDFLLCNDAIKKGNQYMASIAHIWMAKRNMYEKLEGYRDIPYAEDYDFLLRGEIQEFQYANLNEYLYKVRLRGGNTVSSNGLIQRKTADYVKKLHKLELRTKKDCFDEKKYRCAIFCTENEKRIYYNAAMLLSQAITHKNNKIFMIEYTVKAAIRSKYVFCYLKDAVMIRIIKKMEMHNLL